MRPHFCAWGLTAGLVLAQAAPLFAQDQASDDFASVKDEAKLHVASGYICQLHEGRFERDAVGRADADTDFCSYSGLDGVYGTVTLLPLPADYNPKATLAAHFQEQEATGSHMLGQATVKFGEPPFSVYTRSYETATLENLTYTVEFASAAVRNWVVQVTLEYANPRDTAEARAFLKTVYLQAKAQIGR